MKASTKLKISKGVKAARAKKKIEAGKNPVKSTTSKRGFSEKARQAGLKKRLENNKLRKAGLLPPRKPRGKGNGPDEDEGFSSIPLEAFDKQQVRSTDKPAPIKRNLGKKMTDRDIALRILTMLERIVERVL